ncbi:hypothetical protein [Gluconacetobacter entanii]|uniref:Lipoprotein n=1 Tax=Gluconacetobacter entanii TaxID=108528 RepID=A0A318PW48_9PROT|nr:hypothetical protein [Gluconacetobacter entanii]MCE2578415.1 hypothetical protein [Komagataeibacter sp. FNDCR1]PYD63265.1 hypothetical protein CFR72_08060 [Gluconacetobacter entanii]
MHPHSPIPRMSRATRPARMLRLFALGLPLVMLGACHSDQQQPTMTFAQPNYSSLAPLPLNVASISVVDRGQPGIVPGDLSSRAPTPPDQALKQMAHDRLIASGTGGHGVFTIDRASILHEPGGILDGQMNVHLDVVSADGLRKGYAVAQVTRSYDPKTRADGNTDTAANLYDLVNQMMQDMNRELESQIRTNLGNWLTTAPVAGAVAEQSLDGASTPAPAQTVTMPMPNTTSEAATPAVTATPAATAAPVHANEGPDAVFPEGYSSDTATTATKPARQLSPKPGYLTLPAGSSAN